MLARYVGALTDVLAQYLERIYERVSAEEYASRLADSLLVELTCNLIRFTVDPFSAPLHALLEPLAQNVVDAPQLEQGLHVYWPISTRSTTSGARGSRTSRTTCTAGCSTRRRI